MQKQSIPPSPARRIALIMILILMGAACIGTNLLASGNSGMALRIFGGAIIINIVILLLGAVVVALSKPGPR